MHPGKSSTTEGRYLGDWGFGKNPWWLGPQGCFDEHVGKSSTGVLPPFLSQLASSLQFVSNPLATLELQGPLMVHGPLHLHQGFFAQVDMKVKLCSLGNIKETNYAK